MSIRRHGINWLGFVIALVLMGQSVMGIPNLINYQGQLNSSSGDPVTTPVTIVFTFWSAESGGSQLGSGWSDSDTVTPDGEGLYSTLIGDDTSGIPESLFNTDNLYLNINIEGENLVPRMRVTSGGYAFKSANAASMITPYDFGAKGDGVADDTYAVQAALNTGKAVQLSKGRFRITSRLTVPAGGRLVGPGTIYHDFDFILPPGNPSIADIALLISGSDVRLEGFKLEKNFRDGSYGTGIVADNREGIVLSGIDISGYSARYGIHLVECEDFEISRCHIHDFMMNTTADMIQDSPAGIRVTRSHRGSISGNRVLNIENGPTARASISPLIPAYGPQGYQSDCMTIMQCSHVTVEGNTCVISGEGIDMLLSESCTVSNNVIQDHWFQGLKMLGTRYTAVNGNTFYGCYQGIGIAYHSLGEGSANTVVGNVFRDVGAAGSFGVPLGTGGRFTPSGANAIYIDPNGFVARYNLIANNVVVDTQTVKTTVSAVADGGSDNTVVNNTFVTAITDP